MAIMDFCQQSKDSTIQGFLKSFERAIKDLKEGQDQTDSECLKGRTTLTLQAALEFLHHILITKELPQHKDLPMQELLARLAKKAR